MIPDSDSRDYPREETPQILKVKEQSPDMRPREKALRYGVGSLTNAECLAIVLRSGRPGNPVTQIAGDLMAYNNDKFILLERMTDEELLGIDGIGEVKVLEIRVMLEIMRRYTNESMGDLTQVSCSRDIYNIMRMQMRNLPYEQMWALLLNNNNRILRKYMVSEGGTTGTVFDIKKVLKQAILSEATGIALCHNHPSGNTRPSGPDLNITKAFAQACKAVDIRMLDHVIVSTDGYYSFLDEGRL